MSYRGYDVKRKTIFPIEKLGNDILEKFETTRFALKYQVLKKMAYFAEKG
jgi:hypothetical protein